MELLHASLQSSPLGELRGNDRVAKQHALQRVEEVVAPRVAGRDVVPPALQELREERRHFAWREAILGLCSKR